MGCSPFLHASWSDPIGASRGGREAYRNRLANDPVAGLAKGVTVALGWVHRSGRADDP